MTGSNRPSLAEVDWPVRTERLELRPATPPDLEQIWQWRRREDVSRFMTNPSADLGPYLARFSAAERLTTVLAVEHEERVVMDLHVRVQDSYAQADVAAQARGTKANLGWTMDPAVQGQGLATEAVGTVLSICFDRLGLHRVEAACFADNTPSWRLMERVGMRREAHFRDEGLHRDLGWADTFAYAMLRSEWKALRDA